jgi:ABC-type branched-subunit amino acid transport system substrate-binding protein
MMYREKLMLAAARVLWTNLTRCRCVSRLESAVTAEVAGSSPVVPAIPSKALKRISLKPSRARKGHVSRPYAQMQVVAQAVEATVGFDDDASLSAHAQETTFQTVMGAIEFGVKGEWAEPRVLQV